MASNVIEEGFDIPEPDCVFFVLLNAKRSSAVMVADGDRWDLPYFEYANKIGSGDQMESLCHDLAGWLNVSREQVYFTAAVELMGASFIAARNSDWGGRLWLFLMECHPNRYLEDISLPVNVEWKNATHFLSSFGTVNPARRAMGTALRKVMEPEGTYLSTLKDVRYRPGWYGKASKFLTSFLLSKQIEPIGHVIQQQMSYTSTLLKVKSSDGWYYLKAPAVGINEVSITAEIGTIFSGSSPLVVVTSQELNCFVTKEFNHMDLDANDYQNIILKLGQLQIQSIAHLDKLEAAGCPVRDLDSLGIEMEKWLTSDELTKHYNLERLEMVIPFVREQCRLLKEFNIPQTLVHGDMGWNNATYDPPNSQEVLLFDWEFAHIGHPFCDFHRIHESLSEKVLDEYLLLWAPFEDLKRAREAYGIAQKIGWVMKMWSLFERARACNAQHRSASGYWWLSVMDEIYGLFCTFEPSES